MRSTNETKEALREQWVETPSWAYGNTGTRFKAFKNPQRLGTTERSGGGAVGWRG